MITRYLLSFCLFLLSIPLTAQVHNIGVYFGGSYYMGDVNPYKHFYSPNTAQGITYRYNFNARSTLRVNIINTHLSGDDLNFDNAYQQARGHTFRTQINEATAQIAFSYLPAWYEGKDNKRISPYTAIGLGVIYTESAQPAAAQAILPVGIGLKSYLSEKITLNIEWAFRFGYSDYLDLLENDYTENNQLTSNTKQTSFTHNNDLYALFGLMLTYRIFQDGHKCAAYGNFN